jgi:hypothetical protein
MSYRATISNHSKIFSKNYYKSLFLIVAVQCIGVCCGLFLQGHQGCECYDLSKWCYKIDWLWMCQAILFTAGLQSQSEWSFQVNGGDSILDGPWSYYWIWISKKVWYLEHWLHCIWDGNWQTTLLWHGTNSSPIPHWTGCQTPSFTRLFLLCSYFICPILSY